MSTITDLQFLLIKKIIKPCEGIVKRVYFFSTVNPDVLNEDFSFSASFKS